MLVVQLMSCHKTHIFEYGYWCIQNGLLVLQHLCILHPIVRVFLLQTISNIEQQCWHPSNKSHAWQNPHYIFSPTFNIGSFHLVVWLFHTTLTSQCLLTFLLSLSSELMMTTFTMSVLVDFCSISVSQKLWLIWAMSSIIIFIIHAWIVKWFTFNLLQNFQIWFFMCNWTKFGTVYQKNQNKTFLNKS